MPRPKTTRLRKRPLPASAAAWSSAFLAAAAIFLLLNGRWRIFAWYLLISAAMVGAGAVYEIINGRQNRR
jgi:hypothetical protein